MRRHFCRPLFSSLAFGLVLFLCATFAESQVRWDLGAPGSAGAVTTSGSGQPALFAVPNVGLNWCNFPANAVPCTNFATTFTSLTLGTPCPTNAPIVLQGSSTCVATGDLFGNLGVYTASGTYAYTLTVNGVSSGPYVVTLATGGGGGSGTVNSGTTLCAAYYPLSTAAVSPNCGLQFPLTGGVSVPTGNFSVGPSPPTACGSATGCMVATEGSTAGTPTATQDYMRADSVTHNWVCSVNGGPEAACSAGGGGTVTGSGTTGKIPKWTSSTALGNSPLSDNGTNVVSSEPLNVTPTNPSNQLVWASATNSKSPPLCPGSSSALAQFTGGGVSPVICDTSFFSINPPTSGAATGLLAASVSIFNDPGTGSNEANSFSIVGHYGFAQESGTLTSGMNFVSGVAGVAQSHFGVGSVIANLTGVSGIAFVVDAGHTQTGIIAGLDGQIQTQAQGSLETEPFGAAVYSRSPSFTGLTTISHVYGSYVADQTPGGALNPDPHGFYEVGNAPNAFQGHVNQIASGNWAGTCAMAAGTSCTITLTTAYTGTPGCVVTVQSASVIAGGCTVSGTTVTITAASSNSSTWAAYTFGNPN